MASGCTKAHTTIKLTIAVKEKFLKMDDSTTKLTVNGSTWVIEQQHSEGEMMLEYSCILLWFIFYESKMDQN